MKVRLPLMVQDPTTAEAMDIKPVEDSLPTSEDYYLDGPVTARIAVLDFDGDSGELIAGARWVPPGNTLGHYDLPKLPGATSRRKVYDVSSRAFNQVSVMATILRTMNMFEEERVPHRRIDWAFDSPQLLVIPRAGEWANAFYERRTRSLQFFYFPTKADPDKIVYTSLSRDIVAHETAHAVLDAIAPDLYDSTSPQALAIHEAVADLTAVLMAFNSGNLSDAVLRQTNGSIRESTAFSSIAAEFGQALDPSGREQELRNLYNDTTMAEAGVEPHALSEVISGALYRVMARLHEQRTDEYSKLAKYQAFDDPVFSASGEALRHSSWRFRRMLFGALHYLPPGEICFADLGRAMLAVDQGFYPEDDEPRSWLAEQFKKRGIVSDPSDLEVPLDESHEPLDEISLKDLVDSDWVAYQFANDDANRDWLGIPRGQPFKVWPRQIISRTEMGPNGPETREECLFKVSWEQVEPNDLGKSYPAERRVKAGTSLVINCEPGEPRVRALLHAQGIHQVAQRTRYLRHLADEGQLLLDEQAFDPWGHEIETGVAVATTDGRLHVTGTGRMLHVAGREL